MTLSLLKQNKVLLTLCAFVFVALISFVSVVNAAPNYQINYQGKLTDNAGLAVADGLYDMEFKLYNVPTLGTEVWTETLTGSNQVQVTNGLFSVMLGSTTALTGVDFKQTLYLGINIESDGEMTPRKILGTVPAAFEAENANTVGGVASTSFLRSDTDDTASGLLTFTGGLISNSSSTISNLNFTTATGTTLVINGESFIDFTGTALINNSGVLSVNTATLDLLYASTSDFDTSAKLATILSDETGSGSVVFSNSPTLSGTVTGGTFSGGTWNGNTIGSIYGGTGLASYATGDLIYASGVNTLAARTIGTTGQILQVVGGVPTWSATSSLGINSGVSSFLALSDVSISSFTANRIPFTNSGGSAITDSDNFTYNGTNLGLGANNGISFGGTRMIHATGSNYFFGNSAGADMLVGGTYNIGIGQEALQTATSSTGNVAIGRTALKAATLGNSNVAIGRNTLPVLTKGSYNIAIGQEVLENLTTTGENIALGFRSQRGNVNGVSNISIGVSSLGITTGNRNIAIGRDALSGIIDFSSNSTAIGYDALGDLATSTNNTAFGYNAGNGAIGAVNSNNTFIGYSSGAAISTGNNNTILGYQAANSLSSGSNNIIIGYDVEAPSNTADEQLNIGNIIFGTGIDGTGTSLSSGNIGIGTTSPSQKFHVQGSARITGAIYDNTNSAGLNGYVMQSTGTGFNWIATSSLGLVTSSDLANYLPLTGGTLSGNLTFSGTAANISLGSNFLSGDGDDEGIFIDSSGRVGIGTASLLDALNVAGSMSAIDSQNNHFSQTVLELRRMRADSTAPNAGFGTEFLFSAEGFTNNSIVETGIIKSIWENNQTNNTTARDSSMVFQTMLDNTISDKMVITSAGNVGIGSTSPSHKLSVAGDAIITGALYDNTNSAGSSGMVLQSTGTGFNWVATSTLGVGGANPFGATIDPTELTATDFGSFTCNGTICTVDTSAITSAMIADDNIAFGDIDYSITLGGDPSLSANEQFFGTNGIIFEGATANTLEGLLTSADITSTDKTWTLPDLSGTILIGPGANGILARTAAGTTVNRTLIGTTDDIAISNGDGVSGNPTFNFSRVATLGGNPALTASQATIASTGFIFEGSTADTLEGLLASANITGSDKTWTLPNTTGTIITTGDSGTVTGTMISDNTVGLTDVIHTDTLGGNPALASGQCFWASTGIICEGSTADTIETLLAFTDPTGSDVTITFPNSSITVAGLASAMTGTYDGNDFAGGAIGTGDILYGSAAGTISELAGVATGNVLLSGGVATAPAWGKVAVSHLASADFGSFTCNGTTCTVDNSAITAAMQADGDRGFFSYNSGVASLDTGGLTSANLISALTDETGTGNLVFNTSPTFITNITTPVILGGTGTTQDLTFQTTSGVGATGADMHFLVGNNGATEAMTILNNGRIGIGTTTPQSILGIGNTGLTGNVTGGINKFLGLANSTLNAVQYGDRTYVDINSTATSTVLGGIIRLADNTTLGNVVRGFEVQSHRGANTQGENTALSGFARTFGVRGTTEGDAGGLFEPAGGFFQTRGTTQGNAVRGYSSSITTAELLSLFQDTSNFSGTGLLMNFGNGGGTFSSSTSKFVDFQNAGTSKFTVTAHGTTTIGDGTTNYQAGLQIGYGGICVDNDGSCVASTTGKITAVSYGTANSDLAEMYFSSQDLNPGEIVVTDGFLSVKRATADTKNKILGVVSTKPGLTLGFDDSSLIAGEKGYPLALTGRVPIRLSNENGNIESGDPLTLSSIPGIAMKAKESDLIIGYALETFNGISAYTAGFVDQFGDDIAKPNYDPIYKNPDNEKYNDCYFGGGEETGESENCNPEAVVEAIAESGPTDEEIAEARYEAEQNALLELMNEPAGTMIDGDGDTVRVGQIIMFVERGYYLKTEQLDLLNELTSTSSDLVLGTKKDSGETLWSRIKSLAQNFVDGVLTLAGIKVNKIETSELCVDDVCIDAAGLRALLKAANNDGQVVEVYEEDEEESGETEDEGDALEPPVETGTTPTTTPQVTIDDSASSTDQTTSEDSNEEEVPVTDGPEESLTGDTGEEPVDEEEETESELDPVSLPEPELETEPIQATPPPSLLTN